jgi:hypothetical protein
VAEITPSTLDENPCTNSAVHTESEKRLNDKHTSLFQEVLQWPHTLTRTYKGITERMPFVITSRAWKALFQEKEKKNKEEDLIKLERKKEKGKNWKNTR